MEYNSAVFAMVEVMPHLLKFLNPCDRGNLARVCVAFYQSVDPLYGVTKVALTQWSRGDWSDTTTLCRSLILPPLMPSKYLVTQSYLVKIKPRTAEDELAASLEVEEMTELRKEMMREYRIMYGLLEHHLPIMGSALRVLQFKGCYIVCDFLLNSMLAHCPNISELDVGGTSISINAFKGLDPDGCCRKIEVMDFNACPYINDETFCNLCLLWVSDGEEQPAKPAASSPYFEETKMTTINLTEEEFVDYIEGKGMSSTGQVGDAEVVPWMAKRPAKRPVAGLRYLDLHHCVNVSDVSLYALSKVKTKISTLECLDLSGCPLFTGDALWKVVSAAPRLIPERLSYCENIVHGPFADKANICITHLDACDGCRLAHQYWY